MEHEAIIELVKRVQSKYCDEGRQRAAAMAWWMACLEIVFEVVADEAKAAAS